MRDRRNVIASAAKQSILSLRGEMDCFAALAMTVVTTRHTLSRHRPPPGRRFAPPDDRLRRATQYSEASMMDSKGRGVLDTPLSWSMTVFAGGEATKRSIRPARA
jgi:hypothetical protein